MCQAVAVTEEVKNNAPKLPGSLVNTIEDALGSPDKTVLTVKGKVTKVKQLLKLATNLMYILVTGSNISCNALFIYV